MPEITILYAGVLGLMSVAVAFPAGARQPRRIASSLAPSAPTRASYQHGANPCQGKPEPCS